MGFECKKDSRLWNIEGKFISARMIATMAMGPWLCINRPGLGIICCVGLELMETILFFRLAGAYTMVGEDTGDDSEGVDKSGVSFVTFVFVCFVLVLGTEFLCASWSLAFKTKGSDSTRPKFGKFKAIIILALMWPLCAR